MLLVLAQYDITMFYCLVNKIKLLCFTNIAILYVKQIFFSLIVWFLLPNTVSKRAVLQLRIVSVTLLNGIRPKNKLKHLFLNYI
jgi:hypothetical protein